MVRAFVQNSSKINILFDRKNLRKKVQRTPQTISHVFVSRKPGNQAISSITAYKY